MPSTTTTDKESLRIRLVVIRCQVGDENAFRSLYDMFSAKTLRYLSAILDPSLAKDVHQEVWITVYRQVAGLANPGGFRTWLYRMTRNRAIDALRRSARQQELLGVRLEDAGVTVSADDDILLDRELVESVGHALQKLTPTHREVLVLAFWENMSYEEIALVAGCPVGTIRSRLHHAKVHLRRILADA